MDKKTHDKLVAENLGQLGKSQSRCAELLAIRRPCPRTALGSGGLSQQRDIGLAKIKSWAELH